MTTKQLFPGISSLKKILRLITILLILIFPLQRRRCNENFREPLRGFFSKKPVVTQAKQEDMEKKLN
jgi:hypothetical protein